MGKGLGPLVRALVVLVRVMTVPRLMLVNVWYGEACEPGARPWLVAGRRVAEEEGFGSIGLRNAVLRPFRPVLATTWLSQLVSSVGIDPASLEFGRILSCGTLRLQRQLQAFIGSSELALRRPALTTPD